MSRHLCIICSKASLDMAYPGLIMANAARMSGAEASLFFTFWGLDIITQSRVDRLRVATLGNPGLGMPALLGMLPGAEALATAMMKRQLAKLELPGIRALLSELDDAGVHMYACQSAMEMFKRRREDLLPEVAGVLTAMDFMDLSEGAQVLFI